MTKLEPTNKEILTGLDEVKEATGQILEAIGHFSNVVDGRLNRADGRFDKIDQRLDKIEATMVTKDFLTEKLSDLKGDLAILVRKEDHKLAELVKVLEERKVLSDADVKRILAMEPFPQH